MLEEIFGVVELGAKFTMTLTRLEGAKVSQPDTVALLQFADDGFKDGFKDEVSEAPREMILFGENPGKVF